VTGVGTHAPAVLAGLLHPDAAHRGAYKYLQIAPTPTREQLRLTRAHWARGRVGLNGWANLPGGRHRDGLAVGPIAAIYTYKLFGFTELGKLESRRDHRGDRLDALMTWICYRGIDLSARIQTILLGAEVLILTLFAIVAFAKGIRWPPARQLAA